MEAPKAYKSSEKARERAKAWSLANRERRREIQRDHYWRNHERKIGLPALDRLEKSIERIPEAGCWLWTKAVNRNGYGKVKVDGRHLTAHRWSWQINVGAIPEWLHVLHRCDVPACVNPAHLFIGTNQDNVDDKVKKGRAYVLPILKGSDAFSSKLTEAQVIEIRRARGKVTVVGLGKTFEVHHSQISRIQSRKFWKHI